MDDGQGFLVPAPMPPCAIYMGASSTNKNTLVF